MAAEKNAAKGKKPSTLNKLLENEKYRKIIIFAGLAGIALIYISGLFTSDKTASQTSSSKPAVTAQAYETRLENNLTDIITKIQGAGNAKVMITLEQTAKYVYATEEKESGQTALNQSDGAATKNETESSSEKTYLLVKNEDGSETALAVTEIQPVIKGVVIVCDGGDNPAVQQNIINAVTTALHVTSVRVCVLKAK